MASTATTGAILRPEVVEDLLIRPVLAAAVSADARVVTVVRTNAGSVRFPMVTDDPSAAWVAEGAEIPLSDVLTDEVNVEPKKLAGLTVVTSELAEDSSPEAQGVVGQGLSRDLVRKMDSAFFGVGGGNVPAGLGAFAAAALAADVAIGTAPANLDPFLDALNTSRNSGANPTAFVCHPNALNTLSKLKQATGSNAYLLEPDPAKPTGKVIQGVPVIPTTGVAADTIYLVDSSRVYTVVRRSPEVKADASVFFISDRVAVRATMRAAFGFVHPKSVVRLRLAA